MTTCRPKVSPMTVDRHQVHTLYTHIAIVLQIRMKPPPPTHTHTHTHTRTRRPPRPPTIITRMLQRTTPSPRSLTYDIPAVDALCACAFLFSLSICARLVVGGHPLPRKFVLAPPSTVMWKRGGVIRGPWVPKPGDGGGRGGGGTTGVWVQWGRLLHSY